MTVQTTVLTQVDVATGAGVSTVGAATVNTQTGQVTTETLATAAAGTYTFTLTNTLINAKSIVMVSVGKGTATTGGLTPVFVTPVAGSCVLLLQNVTAAALNGTVTINFAVFNMS